MLTDAQKAGILRVYDVLWDVKNSRGKSIAEPFSFLPDKSAWKDYYRVIPHPRSLNGVKVSRDARNVLSCYAHLYTQESLDSGTYQTTQAVFDDLNLVFANAYDGSVALSTASTLTALTADYISTKTGR